MMGMRNAVRTAVVVFTMLAGITVAEAQTLPTIAVPALTYEEKVSNWITVVEARNRAAKEQNDFGKQSFKEQTMTAATGEVVHIERGELNKFSGDIRGTLIKMGFRVVQGRPWTQPDAPSIFDVIQRIQNNFYPGAEYVLFGTITTIDGRNEAIPIQATNAVNYMLSLEMVCDFSLINTKTHEVIASFTAMGEGTDARLINTPGAVVHLSRARVMRDVSRTLAEAVGNSLSDQFALPNPNAPASGRGEGPADNPTTGKAVIYK
jgi:hypothetical protein